MKTHSPKVTVHSPGKFRVFRSDIRRPAKRLTLKELLRKPHVDKYHFDSYKQEILEVLAIVEVVSYFVRPGVELADDADKVRQQRPGACDDETVDTLRVDLERVPHNRIPARFLV